MFACMPHFVMVCWAREAGDAWEGSSTHSSNMQVAGQTVVNGVMMRVRARSFHTPSETECASSSGARVGEALHDSHDG